MLFEVIKNCVDRGVIVKRSELFSVPKAAAHCSLHRATLWNYVNAGEIKTFKTPGGQHRIHREDLEEFMRCKGIYPFLRTDAAKKKVLIVDDEPAIRKHLSQLFLKFGFIVDIAWDGFEAGSKIETFKPGLIVLDLCMPGLDGFEVCRRIKQNPEKSGIRIVAITGLHTKETKEKIMDLGADGYVPKPIDKNALLAVIDRLERPSGD
jgi:excisionase family DNA binding protein